MSSISPAGRPTPDFHPAPDAADAPAEAPRAARATRIPAPGRPTIPSSTLPMPAKWGDAGTLAADLEYLMDRGELVEAKAMLKNAVAIGSRVPIRPDPESERMRKALNETLESFARQRKLDNLILSLDQATRLSPDLLHEQPLSVQINQFLHAHGSEGARQAWNEDSIVARSFGPAVITRDVSEAVNLGVDSLASMHMRRLIDLMSPRAGIDIPTDVPGAHARWVKEKAPTLEKSIQALEKKGVLDDAIRAMKREADEYMRTHPNVLYYPPYLQLRDLVQAHCGADALKTWDRAAARKDSSGADVAKRIEDALARSGDKETLRLGSELARIRDDRGGIDPADASALGDAIDKLKRDGKLDDFVRSLDRGQSESWSALHRRHPGLRPMIYPVQNMIGDALDEVGSPAAKDAWSKAVKAAGKPTGVEVASDIAGALTGGEDGDVAFLADALQYALRPTATPGVPSAAVADLNSAVLALSRRGKLDDLAKTLKRFDSQHPPQGPTGQARFAAFDAAVRTYGSEPARRGWASAVR